MVLTKEELIAELQNEVRILVHLAGKVDKANVNYRPSATQRSTLELLQYLAIMGPTQIAVVKVGNFDREAMMTSWGSAEAKSKAMDFDQAVAAIQQQSAAFASELSQWTEADFRGEINMFGNKLTRGAFIVRLVLGGYAAYRMQLFCYLKANGRAELNTMNLWAGIDGAM